MNNYDNELIIKYIKESNTIADVLRKLGLDPRGRNYKIVKDVIKEFSIETSHFMGKAHCKNKVGKCQPWNDILIENSTIILGTSRKKRLIQEGLLTNNCYNCKLSMWLDKPISLQIDHINGNNTDHRLENLRLLCPNCHSQTNTYAGKNIKKSYKTNPKHNEKNFCKCGELKGVRNALCKACFNKHKSDTLTKIKWPENDILIKMVYNLGYSGTGRSLGVSDNSVKKRIQSRKLEVGSPGGD